MLIYNSVKLKKNFYYDALYSVAVLLEIHNFLLLKLDEILKVLITHRINPNLQDSLLVEKQASCDIEYIIQCSGGKIRYRCIRTKR